MSMEYLETMEERDIERFANAHKAKGLVWVLIQHNHVDYEGTETQVRGVYDSYDKAYQEQRGLKRPLTVDRVDWVIETFQIND